MRVRMIVEYDGTEYAGWQRQPEASTVQGALEKALATVLGHEVRVDAAGRTDAGVHSLGQVAAFTTAASADLRTLERSLNALAGRGIAVRNLTVVADDFDPRREARRRTYEYRILNRAADSPFTRTTAWHVHHPLDVEGMGEAAAHLVGEHDFRSFQAADCDAANPVRTVFESRIERGDGPAAHWLLVYRITATAFLRHMVRNVVGTLVQIGRGERSVEGFRILLGANDRTRAGPTAPPHGLCLVRVDYESFERDHRLSASGGEAGPEGTG